MNKEFIEEMYVVGLSVRTTNQNNQALGDITKLWEQFLEQQPVNKIAQVVSQDIYCLYTEYEGDHNLPYTVILGHRVSEFDHIPEGMVAKTFGGEDFQKFVAKGDLTKGVVYETWASIWQSKINRRYSTDFEVYGEKSADPTNAEVEIYIGVQ